VAAPETLFAEVEAWLAAALPADPKGLQQAAEEAEAMTARLRTCRSQILARLLDLERAERWARSIPAGAEPGAVAIDTRA
jgi:hypothetical protein